MHADCERLNSLGRVIGCAFTVLNALGSGFLEKVYENALAHGVLMVELKTVKTLEDAHRMQCINYLKATGLRLCLLLNFGAPRLEIRRVVLGL